MLYLPLAVGAASAFLPSMPLHASPPTRAAVRTTAVPPHDAWGRDARRRHSRLASWDEYLQSRGAADIERTQEEYLQSKTLRLNLDSEFDGGDSRSGAVGDGNVDLEDQHNAVTLGANRGGVTDLSDASSFVGRGNVQSLVDYDSLPNEENAAKGATEARTSSAGKNYFGRSTGLASKLINEMSDEDVKMGRMDCVRAQQKENWFNQRAIHAQNRAQGQGVVFGQEQQYQPREGGFVARESIFVGGGAQRRPGHGDLAAGPRKAPRGAGVAGVHAAGRRGVAATERDRGGRDHRDLRGPFLAPLDLRHFHRCAQRLQHIRALPVWPPPRILARLHRLARRGLDESAVGRSDGGRRALHAHGDGHRPRGLRRLRDRGHEEGLLLLWLNLSPARRTPRPGSHGDGRRIPLAHIAHSTSQRDRDGGT